MGDVVNFSRGGVCVFPLFSFLLAVLVVFVGDGLVLVDFWSFGGGQVVANFCFPFFSSILSFFRAPFM